MPRKAVTVTEPNGVSSFAMALARLSSGRVTLSGETAF